MGFPPVSFPPAPRYHAPRVVRLIPTLLDSVSNARWQNGQSPSVFEDGSPFTTRVSPVGVLFILKLSAAARAATVRVVATGDAILKGLFSACIMRVTDAIQGGAQGGPSCVRKPVWERCPEWNRGRTRAIGSLPNTIRRAPLMVVVASAPAFPQDPFRCNTASFSPRPALGTRTGSSAPFPRASATAVASAAPGGSLRPRLAGSSCPCAGHLRPVRGPPPMAAAGAAPSIPGPDNCVHVGHAHCKRHSHGGAHRHP